jgi:hypothetical protein
VEKAGALCRILAAEEDTHEPPQQGATAPADPKPGEGATLICPKCEFEQQRSEECIKCGIIFRKFVKDPNVEKRATAKEVEPDNNPVLDGIPEKKHRDWLPTAVFGIALLILLIVVLRGFFAVFSSSPVRETAQKTSIKEKIAEAIGDVKSSFKPQSAKINDLIVQTPLLNISDVDSGFVKIRGRVEKKDNARHNRCPISTNDCLYYKWIFDYYGVTSGSIGGSSWVVITSPESVGSEFIIVDETGEILVSPHLARSVILLNASVVKYDRANIPANAKKVKKYETNSDDSIFEKYNEIRVTEYFIRPGDNVIVLGTVKVKEGKKVITHGRGPQEPGYLVVKRLGSVTRQAKEEKTPKRKPESYRADAGDKKVATLSEKSHTSALPGQRVGQQENGLIAFYPFNGNANDESGNGNHGTVYGAATAEDRFGNVDSAYSFDGVDDYVDIGRPLVSEDFTISFWLKSNGRQNRFAVPVSQGNMSYRGFSFTFTKGPYNGFNWGTWKDKKTADPNWGKSAWHTLNFNFPKDIKLDLTWHHLAATQKGNTITVYRDGEFQGTVSGFLIVHGRFDFNIGRASGNRDFNHRAFNGVIDDIRIYNRALSEGEILDLYKALYD